MRYISTRDPQAASASFCDILLAGLAPDGGLYLPETYPQLSAEQLKGLLDMREQEKHPELHGYVQDGNVITANGWWFREWAMAVCRALQLPFYPKSFGLEIEE